MNIKDPRYIGARYVPRFMGNHNPTQLYEGLDVVDDGRGVLYISKQPVPINTPLTDRSYWVVYGGLQNILDQIDAINDEIADMKDGTVTGSLQNQINGESAQLASNITLYRLSSLRVLFVKGAAINTLTGLTLDVTDRPSDRLTAAVAYYGFIGRFILQSDGSIKFYQYQTYGDITATDISNSTATVDFTVCWTV